MPRPQKNRKVNTPPLFSDFKPSGISSKNLEQIILTLDEFEAIRLSDFTGMTQEEAADEMEISRPTFTRLIENARKKFADFLINGKNLFIEGGNVHFKNNILICNNCGHIFKVKINSEIKFCPHCGKENFKNLAGNFGHGICCAK